MLALFVCYLALTAVAEGNPPATGTERNIESFEYVWRTIRDNHWDSNYNGVNWQAVRDELRPRIEKVTSKEEARKVLMDMLGRLKQTHFGIIPSEAYKFFEVGSGATGGSPGIDVRLIGSRLLVTAVDRGSPAEEAGIVPGWEIVAIGASEVAPAVTQIAGVEKNEARARHVARARALSTLYGEIGSVVDLRLLDSQGRPVDRSLRRLPRAGKIAQFGNLPPAYMRMESRRLTGNVHYIGFNAFLDPETILTAAGDAVKSCGECKGIVIDVRGNGGGLGAMVTGLIGWFVEKGVANIGTVHFKETVLRLVVNPRPGAFRGPVAVLVDEGSASAAEFLAGGMQDLGRARVFGTKTVGAALPSALERLPNGDGFQYAFANYLSAAGRPLEGIGVIPDITVEHTRESLLAGRDAQLEAAQEWIKRQ